MRPDILASDTASSYSVIMHALSEFEKRGLEFDRVVLLQPTPPLRRIDDIRKASALWSKDVDMVVSVCEAKTNPYYNAFETDSEGMLHISKGDGHFTRRQDAPKVWEYNGAVYVMTVTRSARGFLLILTHTPLPMPSLRSVDLDTPGDWIIAETLFSRLNDITPDNP